MFQNILKALMQQILLNTKARVLRGAGRPTTRVQLAPGVALGGRDFVVMAGPCAIEEPRQIATAAETVAAAGCPVLRGGAFKPRTSPYSFQGLGDPGVRLLAETAARHGLASVSEIMPLGWLL